jgi:hypothetical protein
VEAGADEVLETGYGSATAVGDNLLNDYARAEATAFATLGAHGRVEHDRGLDVSMVDTGVPTPFGNTVNLLRPLRDEEIPEFVARTRDFYGAAPGGPFLVLSPWPIADLGDHGFHRVGHPPLMLRPPAPLTVGSDVLRVQQVEDEETLADFERTMIDAYPIPEMAPFGSASRFVTTDVLGGPLRLYVGYEDDRPVATAAGHVGEGPVVVVLVSTRDECRGRGHGAVITAAATLSDPARPAMLIASDLGQPVYERLGYLRISRHTLWLGTR